MAAHNLFTPAFGGLPQVFFGRKRELAFAADAITNANSPHKAFFITGNRGCGKTTLLEKISSLASEHGWISVDVHSAHASRAIIEALAGGTQKTVAKDASPSAFGMSLTTCLRECRSTKSPATRYGKPVCLARDIRISCS